MSLGKSVLIGGILITFSGSIFAQNKNSNCSLYINLDEVRLVLEKINDLTDPIIPCPTLRSWVENTKHSTLALYFQKKGYDIVDSEDLASAKVYVSSGGGFPLGLQFDLYFKHGSIVYISPGRGGPDIGRSPDMGALDLLEKMGWDPNWRSLPKCVDL